VFIPRIKIITSFLSEDLSSPNHTTGVPFIMPVDYIGFAYAATVAAGGIIGYAKAGMTINYNIPDMNKLYFFMIYMVQLLRR